MSKQRVSDWIAVEGHCATRVLEGTDPAVVANRVAFIEKSPRVRVLPWSDSEDWRGWAYGTKGSGGGYGEDHEKLGQYGFDPTSRAWCDARLIAMGYDVPNPVTDPRMTELDLG